MLVLGSVPLLGLQLRWTIDPTVPTVPTDPTDPTAEVRDFSWQAICLQNSIYRGHRSYLEESRKLSLSSTTGSSRDKYAGA
jgi:hypothetical protein